VARGAPTTRASATPAATRDEDSTGEEVSFSRFVDGTHGSARLASAQDHIAHARTSTRVPNPQCRHGSLSPGGAPIMTLAAQAEVSGAAIGPTAVRAMAAAGTPVQGRALTPFCISHRPTCPNLIEYHALLFSYRRVPGPECALEIGPVAGAARGTRTALSTASICGVRRRAITVLVGAQGPPTPTSGRAIGRGSTLRLLSDGVTVFPRLHRTQCRPAGRRRGRCLNITCVWRPA